jgi:hypothetical protein
MRVQHPQEAGTPAGPWWSRWLPALVLGALFLIAFRGPLSGRVFYLRDISQNHYPIRHYVTERMRSGDLPLWDPLHGGGTPLLANPNSLILHPISSLFVALPFDLAFTLSILLQFLLLAFGGYLLARKLGTSRQGATLAAAILSLSGPAASLASLQNVLSAAAWVPIGLWLWLRGLEPGRRWTLAAAALVLAVILIAAEPASLLAYMILAPVLGVLDEGRRNRNRGSIFVAFAIVLILGGLIAAAQILPARALLPLSARGDGLPDAEGLKWSLQPFRLLAMVVPRLLGDPTRLHPASWWGGWLFEGRYPFLLSIYLGVVPCGLAILAMFGRGRGERRRRALGAIVLAGTLLALGGHGVLYRFLYRVFPVVDQIRYPERFLLMALLPLALLAALGLDLLTERAGTAARRRIVGSTAVAGAAFVALTLFGAFPAMADRLLSAGAAVPQIILEGESGAVLRGGMLRSSLWMFGEAAILAAGTILALGRSPISRSTMPGWGIVIASGISMMLAATPALSTADPGWMKSESPLLELVGRGHDAPRLHHEPRPEGLSVWGKTDELAWGYRFDRFNFALGSGHLERVPTIFDPATDRMDLGTQAGLGREMQQLPIDERIRILTLGHAGLLLAYAPIEHPGLEPGPVLDGFSRPPVRVYRIRSVLPRVRFVPRARRASWPDDLARSLADPDLDPTREVILEPPQPAARLEVPEGGTTGRTRILQDEPEKLSIEVEAPVPGFLVVSDAYDPGWRAEVDGESSRLLRADGLFRAVPVGAGLHTVTMRYAPTAVRLGLIISGLGLMATIGWGLWSWRARA